MTGPKPSEQPTESWHTQTPGGSARAESVPKIEGYEILGRLGEGGMGIVWKAVQLSTRREVALKFLAAGAFATDKQRHRFEREVELAAALEHPNIARVYDSGLTHGGYYYAMQLIPGVPLDEYVRVHQLPRRDILELMRTVCLAVQHAHQRGVIHRDLKPANVLVTQDGQPYVLDFGLAKDVLGPDETRSISSEGGVTGTIAYMSPEQASGKHKGVDTRTDVYSLAVMLFRLVTGVTPHDLRGSRYEVLRRIAEEEVRRPREVGRFIDRDLEALLLKALARDPARRYATAGDIAEDIGNYLKHDPLQAQPRTAAYFLAKKMRKHIIPVTIGTVAVVSFITLTMYSYVRITHELGRAVMAENRTESALTVSVASEKKAKEEAEAARRALYFSRIALAYAEHEQCNAGAARELLEACPGDLRGWEWHYLNRVRDRSLMTLRGHTAQVNSVAFSPDGKRIVSGGNDCMVRVWDAATGLEIMKMNPSGYVYCVAYSPRGDLIASGGGVGNVTLLDATSGKAVASLRGHDGYLNSVAFSSDGTRLVSGGSDKTVSLWDVAKATEVMKLAGPESEVYCVSFSPRGKWIGSAERSGMVRIWNGTTGEPYRTISGFGWHGTMRFSRDNRWVYATDAGYTVTAWDIETGTKLKTLRGHRRLVRSIALNPGGGAASPVTAGDDRVLRLWNYASDSEINALHGHEDVILSVTFDPAGERLASGSIDGTVRVWDAAAGPEHVRLRSGVRPRLAFTGDSSKLVECSSSLRVWDMAARPRVTILEPSLQYSCAIAVTPDGARIVGGGPQGSDVRVLDLHTGAQVFSLLGHESFPQAVAVSRDGKQIASADEKGFVKIWDAESGACRLAWRGHSSALRSLEFSPDGRTLLGKGTDDLVKTWDADKGSEIFVFGASRGFREWGTNVAFCNATFHPQGRWIASGNHDGTMSVYDTLMPDKSRTLRGHGRWVYSVAFNPDGTRLASASLDGTVKLWDFETGANIVTLEAGGGAFYCAAFSPDGRILAAGDDGGVLLWDSGSWDDNALTTAGNR